MYFSYVTFPCTSNKIIRFIKWKSNTYYEIFSMINLSPTGNLTHVCPRKNNHSEKWCVSFSGVIWIEKVCQKWHTFYKELLTFDDFFTEWWTWCVKINKLYAIFMWHTWCGCVANDTPIRFVYLQNDTSCIRPSSCKFQILYYF